MKFEGRRMKDEIRCQWRASFAEDAIDLRGLPRSIVLKTRTILAQLATGVGFWQFKGKRFAFDRTLITIPVTYRYRLLCRLDKSGLRPLKVMSHEAYNAVARNRVSMGK